METSQWIGDSNESFAGTRKCTKRQSEDTKKERKKKSWLIQLLLSLRSGTCWMNAQTESGHTMRTLNGYCDKNDLPNKPGFFLDDQKKKWMTPENVQSSLLNQKLKCKFQLSLFLHRVRQNSWIQHRNELSIWRRRTRMWKLIHHQERRAREKTATEEKHGIDKKTTKINSSTCAVRAAARWESSPSWKQ